MPWSEVSPMDQKRFFIKDYVAGSFSIADLAARYGVSRKTAYKWIERFEQQGYAGLDDRCRRPHTSPTQVDEENGGQDLAVAEASSSVGPEEAAVDPGAASSRGGLAGALHGR
jgi:putative transposase